MNNKRVVIVSTGSHSMGTNYRILSLAQSAKRLGLDVHIILPGLVENQEWFGDRQYDGVPIHFTRIGALLEMYDKYRILRSLKPQFVHCVDVVRKCFIPSVAYRLMNQCVLIVDIDEHLSRIKLFGVLHRFYLRVCENLAKRYADRLIVASRFLEQWFGEPKRCPVLYLPNAVDLEGFQKMRTGWETLKLQWGGKKVVMYFGNLSSHYDADMVFEAAEKILMKRRDLVFVFVGGGEILASLRDRSKELHLEDNIQLCGFVPDEAVPKYLSAADVFVFPIRDNWWNRARCPGKVYYFTAAMTPIVTNPVGEVYEALGDCAWYFKNGDIDDFIRVTEECLLNGRANRCPDVELANRHNWLRRAEAYCEFLNEGDGLMSTSTLH